MKYLHLIYAALLRRKVRTTITVLSIVVAFLLFGLLDSVRSAFVRSAENIGEADNLIVFSKISLATPLPISLGSAIESMPGVKRVGYGAYFGGAYQNPKNTFPVEAESDNYFDIYPEWRLSPAELNAFHNTRTGAVAEEGLARKYHWKVGDKIPVQTAVPQKNGATIWTFDLVGTYRLPERGAMDGNPELIVRWKFFDEARLSEHGTVGWYIAEVVDVMQADAIAQMIDALSANSDHETLTQSVNAFVANFSKQFANVGLIVGSIMGAVFFSLMFLTGNTMAQTVRERIPELAVLKTLGFTRGTVMGLVLSEAITLLLVGGTLGLAAASGFTHVAQSIPGMGLPLFPVPQSTWMRGLALAVLIGVLVGTPPAMRAMRLRIVDALAGR